VGSSSTGSDPWSCSTRWRSWNWCWIIIASHGEPREHPLVASGCKNPVCCQGLVCIHSVALLWLLPFFLDDVNNCYPRLILPAPSVALGRSLTNRPFQNDSCARGSLTSSDTQSSETNTTSSLPRSFAPVLVERYQASYIHLADRRRNATRLVFPRFVWSLSTLNSCPPQRDQRGRGACPVKRVRLIGVV
jgi:hypothetical protein